LDPLYFSVHQQSIFDLKSGNSFNFNRFVIAGNDIVGVLQIECPTYEFLFLPLLLPKLASSEEDISRNFTSFLLSELLWADVCLLFVVVEIGLRLEQLTKKVVTANAAKIILDILVPFLERPRPGKPVLSGNRKCIIVFLTRQF
jgi:hypothetical protein